ncbi:MAG: hypothetical protein ABH951_01075 [Patescibacteria group bacterium]
MKTSFNFEKHRKDILDKFKKTAIEKGSFVAKEELKKEQEDIKYKISKDLELTERQIKKEYKAPSEGFEKKIISIGKQDITQEVDKCLSLKYPEEVGKHDFTLETFDISDRIPESLKLYIDTERMDAVESKSFPATFAFQRGLKQMLIDDLKKYGDGWIKNDDKENNLVKTLTYLLVNKLTEGEFSNENNINHVVFGAFDSEPVGPQTPSRKKFEDEREKRLYWRDLKERDTVYGIGFDPNSTILGEIPFSDCVSIDRYKAGERHRAGHYLSSPSKPIIIVNPLQKRFLSLVAMDENSFKNKIQKEKTKTDMGIYFGWNYDGMNEYKNKKGLSGRFGLKWTDLADWIVDLPSGKLYKITEKEK